jgi:H+/Cl- antiporter ClcA
LSKETISEFKPPVFSAQSPLLDPTIAGETRAFENNEDQDQAQKRNQDKDIHGMRMSHSRLLLGLALIWIFVILGVVLLQGFGQWFTPLSDGYVHIPFKLSDTVVIAFITSTTATVLGLYGIAAYWLYGKPKQEEKPSSKDKKKPS